MQYVLCCVVGYKSKLSPIACVCVCVHVCVIFMPNIHPSFHHATASCFSIFTLGNIIMLLSHFIKNKIIIGSSYSTSKRKVVGYILYILHEEML